MVQSLSIIIIDKNSVVKSLNVKDFKEEELFKKAGFKKEDGFEMQTEWNVKLDGKKYNVSLYGKLDGKANMENKYDFPPPVDNALFFGSCVLVCSNINEKNEKVYINLSIDLWTKIYEKLFGGFENLDSTIVEDEEEEDELENVPKKNKTKHGYLKDGFVVDSDGCEEDTEYETEDESNLNESTDDETDKAPGEKEEEDILLEDIGSELSEESYDYN